MKDPVEARLKAEIDHIMENVDNVLKKLKNFETGNRKTNEGTAKD